MYVFLLSDKAVFKKGISFILFKWKEDLTIKEFTHMEETFAPADETPPHLLIFDLDTASPEYPSLMQKFRDIYPKTGMVSMSTELDERVMQFLTSFSVNAHLLMDVQQEELALALNQVLMDKPYFDQRLTQALLQRGNFSKKTSASPAGMTDRQLQILRLVCEEHTNKEIAEMLGISSRTVDGHRFRLIKRFGVKNTAGLIRYALENNLL